MKFQRLFANVFLFALMSVFAFGCSSPKNPLLTSSPGGGDPSGGELRVSSPEAVDEAIRNLKQNLHLVFARLAYAQRMLPDRYPLLDQLFDPSLESISATLERIQIKPVDGDCYGDGKWKAASMDERGNLCLSWRQLALRPPEVLVKEMIPLAAHEVGHARKLPEAECQELQNFLTINTNYIETDLSVIRQQINGFRQFSETAAKLAWAMVSPGVFPALVCERFSQLSLIGTAIYYFGYERNLYPVKMYTFLDLDPAIGNVAVAKDARGCFFAHASPRERQAAIQEALQLVEATHARKRDIEAFLVPHEQTFIDNFDSSFQSEMYGFEARAKLLEGANANQQVTTSVPQILPVAAVKCSLWNNTKEQEIDAGVYDEPTPLRHAASFETSNSLRNFGQLANWLSEIQFIGLNNSYWSPDFSGIGISVGYFTTRPDLHLQTLASSNWFAAKGRALMGVGGRFDREFLRWYSTSFGFLHPLVAREARWDFRVVDGDDRPLVPEEFSLRCKLE